MAGNSQVSVATMTSQDMQELMTGSAHDGSPTPQEAWGLGDEVGTPAIRQRTPAELEIEAQVALQRATYPEPSQVAPPMEPQYNSPATVAEVAAVYGELEKFKDLYGRSENEKGELRRALQEQMDSFNQTMLQMQQLQGMGQAGPASPYGYGPPQQPVYNPAPAPPAYGYAPPQGRDPFSDMPDEEMVYGKHVKKLMQETVAPAVAMLAQSAQDAQRRVQQLEAQVIAQSKITAGITPADEVRLEQRNPWLRTLPPSAKVAAMFSVLQNEKVLRGVGPSALTAQPPPSSTYAPSPAPARPTPIGTPGQQVVRQMTHVESTPSSAPDLTGDAVEAAKQRDWQNAQMLPDWDDRTKQSPKATAMRQFAIKYGLPWGTADQVIGR